MAYKRITSMDIYEIIRRWHFGQNISHISIILGYDRKTVRKYIELAQDKGISLKCPLSEKERVLALLSDDKDKHQRSRKAQDILMRYLDEIKQLVNDPLNPLKAKHAFEVICSRYDLAGKVSYTSFKRFVRENQILIRPDSTTCRIEVDPAEEVQVDYAKVGLLFDPVLGKRRTVYAFIATLSYSRHKFVELVLKQDQKSFVASHVRMFDHFCGVPQRIIIDNLKCGVLKPDLYEPRLNPAYRELAEHYDCFIDPARVAHPKDKGKVERDVQTVRDQFRKLLALYPHLDIRFANEKIRDWLKDEYGQKHHGTTGKKPYQSFIEEEKPQLLALPNEPFELATWKCANVHPDHYIQFEKKAYSVPHNYVSKQVWVRGWDKIVKIYYDGRLIKQHVKSGGFRHTDINDFPENVRMALDKGIQKRLQIKAARIGANFEKLVRNILKTHAFINLRCAQGVMRLSDQFDDDTIEEASQIALKQKMNIKPKSFKRLLEVITEQKKLPQQIPLSQTTLSFVREMAYFFDQPQT